jgi:predicted PurR-regulated permease PerM
MKKALYIFLVACIFFLGVLFGRPTGDTEADLIEDKIDKFENEITNPNGDYISDKKSNINPNLSNSLAKSGESVINGIFSYAFGLLDGIVK